MRAPARTSRRTRILSLAALAAVVLPSCAWFRPERIEKVAVVTETLPPGAAPPQAAQALAAPPGAKVPGRVVFKAGSAPATNAKANYASAPGVTAREIVIGTIQPMDGPAAQLGKPLYRATQAYVNALNARGGINGRSVRLELQTACINCEAENLLAAKALVQQKHVFAVVNTYMNTYAFNAALTYLEQQKVPLIMGQSTTREDAWDPKQSDWAVFYTIRNADFTVIFANWLDRVMAQWAEAGELPNPAQPRWVATVALDAQQDRRRSSEFKKNWEARGPGYRVTSQQYVAAEEESVTRMDSFIAAMKQSGANGVYSASNITMVFGMQAADRQDWKVPWIAKSVWGRAATDNCGAACDGGFTDNLGWGWPEFRTPQMKQYMDAMRRYYPDGVRYADAQTLGGWIGLEAFEYAVGQLGADVTRSGLLRILTSLRNFDTGVGATISVTPGVDHMGMNELILLQICKNKFWRVSDWVSPTDPLKRIDNAGDCDWGY